MIRGSDPLPSHFEEARWTLVEAITGVGWTAHGDGRVSPINDVFSGLAFFEAVIKI